jgi:hypothetical protein
MNNINKGQIDPKVDYPYSLDPPLVWRTMKKTNEMGTSQVTKRENRSMKNFEMRRKPWGLRLLKLS